MRFSAKVDRSVVKCFIQKDKTITCPVKGDYYALIDSDSNEILSALCIVDCNEYYHVQSMRTEKKNRNRGYSTELLKYAISLYKDKPIHADCLAYSKNIFLRLGFTQATQKIVGRHTEYVMERGCYGKTENRD